MQNFSSVETDSNPTLQLAENVGSDRVLVAQALLPVRVLQLSPGQTICARGVQNRTAKSGCATQTFQNGGLGGNKEKHTAIFRGSRQEIPRASWDYP
jgi:hypothetical protein